MVRIFIFRHGQTFDNRNHTFSGWRDVDLTPEGIDEAKLIGIKLKDEPVNKAYQSDQIRSKQTLELVLNGYHKNVEIITDPRIKERNYGDLTGKNKDEVAKKEPEKYELWHRSYDIPPPNGETIQMVEKRVFAFLDDLKTNLRSEDIIFISAHGNSIRPMRKYFEGLTNEEIMGYEYTPGQIFSYEI